MRGCSGGGSLSRVPGKEMSITQEFVWIIQRTQLILLGMEIGKSRVTGRPSSGAGSASSAAFTRHKARQSKTAQKGNRGVFKFKAWVVLSDD